MLSSILPVFPSKIKMLSSLLSVFSPKIMMLSSKLCYMPGSCPSPLFTRCSRLNGRILQLVCNTHMAFKDPRSQTYEVQRFHQATDSPPSRCRFYGKNFYSARKYHLLALDAHLITFKAYCCCSGSKRCPNAIVNKCEY